jgi:hypothetical protein
VFPGCGQPAQPAAGPPAAAPAGAESCTETLRCYSTCDGAAEPCLAACEARAAPDVPTVSRAAIACISQSGCQDQDCVLTACRVQIEACTNATVAAAPAPAPPVADPARSGGVVGRWATSASGGFEIAGAHAGYVMREYVFNADGSYRFRLEGWGGSLRSDTYYIVDESGSYVVAGNQLTVTPGTVRGAVKNRQGQVTSALNVPVESVTYAWTTHYFAGIQENNLVLTPPAKTQRDGEFASNELFPSSYMFSATYKPDWTFP